MSRECPLCHELLCDDAPEAASGSIREAMRVELAGAKAAELVRDIRDLGWFAATRPEPLYRVTWGRGPTRTMPMSWPRVLSFVRAARRARPGLPITVERATVPPSPTHPEEPR